MAAGRFINKPNLAVLAKCNSAWRDVQADVEATEAILGVKFHPETKDDLAHQALSSKLLDIKSEAERTRLINKMAALRKSLG